MNKFQVLLLISLCSNLMANENDIHKFFNVILNGANAYYFDDEENGEDFFSKDRNTFNKAAGLAKSLMFNNKKNKKRNLKFADKLAFLNDSFYEPTSNTINRSAFFSDRVLKYIVLSPKATHVAFSRINNENYEIVIKSTGNVHSKKIFTIEGEVLSLKFLDESHLVYVLREEDGSVHLSLVELTSRGSHSKISSIFINNERNAKSIRILKAKQALESKNVKIAVEVFDGITYSTYIIDLKSSDVKLIHKSPVKDAVLFDVDVNPVAFFDNFQDSGYFVYDKTFLDRNIESNGHYDQIQNLTLLSENIDLDSYCDRIQNRLLEKYVSAGKDFIYKLKLSSNKINLIRINKKDWKKETVAIAEFDKNIKYSQKNLKIDDYNVCMNRDGCPIFVNFLGEKGFSFYFNNTPKIIKKAISYLNSKCGNNWYRVESSKDGNIWLLCIRHFDRGNEYCLFDIRNKVLNRVKSSHPGLKNLRLNTNTYVRQIEIKNEKIIPITLTLSKSEADTPFVLLIQMNDSNYRNGFMSFSQFLANRGYNVISINYNNYVDFKKIAEDKDAQKLFFENIKMLADDIMLLLQKLGIDKGKLFAIGEKIGGAVAQRLYSLKNSPFSKVVSIKCPIFGLSKKDWKQSLKSKRFQTEFLLPELKEDKVYNYKDISNKRNILIINPIESLTNFDKNFLKEHNVTNMTYYKYRNTLSDYAKSAIIESFLSKTNKKSKFEAAKPSMMLGVEKINIKSFKKGVNNWSYEADNNSDSIGIDYY